MVLLISAVNLPVVHTFLTNQTNSFLKAKGWPLKVGGLSISISGKIELNQIELLSTPVDTIVYAKDIKVAFSILPLLSKRIILNDVFLEGVNANLISDSTGQLNLLSAFSISPEANTDDKESGSPWEIQVKNVSLKNIRFSYIDILNGINVNQQIKVAELSFDKFSLLDQQIDIDVARIENADGFAYITPSTTTDSVKSDSSQWKFSAGQITLVNVFYTYENPVSNQKLSVNLKQADVSVEKLDLSDRMLIVNALNLDIPRVNFKPATVHSEVEQSTQPEKLFPFAMPWTISCKKLGIKDGEFEIDTIGIFESSTLAQWLPLQNLNTTINDISLNSQGSVINVNLLSFSLNDKLSLESGKILVNADSMLNGMFSLDLLASVRSNGEIPSAYGDSVSISAILSGSPELLKIEKFDISSLSGMKLAVSGILSELTELPESNCNLAFHTNSISRNQAVQFLTAINLQQELPFFKPVAISGKVFRTLDYPEFIIDINSNSGNINLTGDFNINSFQCKLDAGINNLKTGEIFGESFPEIISCSVNWDGIVGELDELKGEGLLNINKLVYRDLTTNDLNFDFEVSNNICEFVLFSEDSTLDCNLTGSIDWVNETYNGNLKGNFIFNEGKSSLFPDQLTIRSTMNAGFKYSPMYTEATLLLHNFEVENNYESTLIDSILWELKLDQNSVSSQASADFFDAEFICEASISDFLDAIKNINYGKIIRTDSEYFLNATNISAFPVFELNFTAKYDSIFGLFIPDTVFNFNNVILNAFKAPNEQMVKLEFSTDSIKYENFQSHGANLSMISDERILNAHLTVDSFNVNGTRTGVSDLKFDVLPDKISGSLFIADTTGAPVYQLSAEALKEKERILFRTTDPDWILNSDTWNISKKEFLIWEIPENDFIAEVDLKHNGMNIKVNGRKSDSLVLDFNNVLISKIISQELISMAPDGILNANIVYSGTGNQLVDFNVNIKNLDWQGILVDNVDSKGFFKTESAGKVDGEVSAVLDDSASVNLTVSSVDSLSEQLISLDFDKIPVQFMEAFTDEYINKMDGYASGKLNLKGVSEEKEINGEINLKNVTLNIIPLQAWFTIPNDTVLIKSNVIYFNNFLVLDSLNKQLSVDGTLSLKNSEQIIADLKVGMDNIRVVNTTVKDNPNFYGSVIVNSSLDISGPVTNPSIKGNVRLQEGTKINYRQTQDRSVQEIGNYVTFASLNTDTSRIFYQISKVKELTGTPLIQTTIDIDPKSIFNFEISSGYDIHISISGSGLLNYSMLPNNTMSLTGTYEINSGKADLKFTGWPLKYFTITKGSTVRWDGDVSDPEVNLEATSLVKGSYMNPVDNKTRYVDFIVSMKLMDQVSSLRVVFDVKSPDQYISSVLNTLPEDELMRQAINLLIFESINLPNIESSSNYLTSQMNSFWESQLNSLTKTSIKKVDLSFGIDSYTQTSAGGAEEEKTSLTYAVERKFFKDRATVKLSGRFNDETQAGQQSNTMIENFIFEYQLDSTERKFLKLYTKKDYEDILDGEVTKSGIGFIYRKSYPDFRSIWTRKKKASPESNLVQPKRD